MEQANNLKRRGHYRTKRGWFISSMLKLAIILVGVLCFSSNSWAPCATLVGDLVWNDLNHNGVQDNGEPGLEGVRVVLKTSSGTFVEETYTDTSGHYEFTNHCPDDFVIEVDESTLPEGFIPSPCSTDPSSSGTGNDIDSNCSPQAFTLGANEHNDTIDFGYYLAEQPASLGDRVWNDLNGNGVQDCTDSNNNGIIGDSGDSGPECDAGIENIKVDLVDCQDPDIVLDSTYTDADGFYGFANLDEGTYCVKVNLDTVPPAVCSYGEPRFTEQNQGADDKDSDVSTSTGMVQVSLEAGETDLSVDAGISCPGPASLGDRVWNDLNGNGVQDCTDSNNNGIIGDSGDSGPECDAGIENIKVDLVDCQNPDIVLDSTYTDADGFYSFANLDEGTYCVKVNLDTVPPAVCGNDTPIFTIPDSGPDDKDSDVIPDTGIVPAINLSAGQTNLTTDAGITCKIEECGKCDGKVTKLTLQYNGTDCAYIEVVQKKCDVIFADYVCPGETFTVTGADRDGTLGNEIRLYVDGCLNTKIHTSCSRPIGIGMVLGDFTVVDGYSKNGGKLCPVDQDDGCGNCCNYCCHDAPGCCCQDHEHCNTSCNRGYHRPGAHSRCCCHDSHTCYNEHCHDHHRHHGHR